MVHPPLLDVELLRQAGVEEQLGGKIEQVEIVSKEPQRHSITGILAVQLENQEGCQIFFKKFIPLLQKDTEYLRSLHTRFWKEATFLPVINTDVDPSLVPKVLGRLVTSQKPPYFLFMEVLAGPSAYDQYLDFEQAYKTMKLPEERREINQRKLTFLRRDLQYIARFNGLCQAHRQRFETLDEFINEAHQRQYAGLSNALEHYLKRAVHFWNLGGEDYFHDRDKKQKKYDGNKTLRWLREKRGVDLRGRTEEVVQLSGSIKSDLELQHGDCRLQHNFNGTFCDLEDFGNYPSYRDIVTYTSEEIVAPPVSELPNLLANYLLHKTAYSLAVLANPSLTPQQLEEMEIDKNYEHLQQLIRDRIGISAFGDFVVGYFAGMIEEDIVINGARKKPSLEYFERLLPTYPNHSPERLQKSRLKHIEELYSFITSPAAMYVFQHCTNPDGVVRYFFHLGKLLNDLDLTEITNLGRLETLEETLGSTTQYTFFFANGLAKGRKSA